MENRCVCCGEIIPEGQQVCKRCKGGSRMMRNGSGYPSPVEDEAIGNITREENRRIDRIFKCIIDWLGFIGLELVSIQIMDKRSRRKHSWPPKRK